MPADERIKEIRRGVYIGCVLWIVFSALGSWLLADNWKQAAGATFSFLVATYFLWEFRAAKMLLEFGTSVRQPSIKPEETTNPKG